MKPKIEKLAQGTCKHPSEIHARCQLCKEVDGQEEVFLALAKSKFFNDVMWVARLDDEDVFLPPFANHSLIPSKPIEVSYDIIDVNSRFIRNNRMYRVEKDEDLGLTILETTIMATSQMAIYFALLSGVKDPTAYLVKFYEVEETKETFVCVGWVIRGENLTLLRPAFSDDFVISEKISARNLNWEPLYSGDFFTRDGVIWNVKEEKGILCFAPSKMQIKRN